MAAVSETAQQVHDAALIVDLHCDLLLTTQFLRWDWTRQHRPNPLPGAPLMGHTDIPRLKAGNIGCMALGVVTGPWRLRSGPSAILSDFDRLDRVVEQSPDDLVIAVTPQAIRSARQQGRIGCFCGLEGAHGLDGRLDLLPELKRRGLGYVGFVHFSANRFARPMVGLGASNTKGLTDEGRALLVELNRLGIAVDVAHLNKPGVLEVCERTRVPVICSHSACRAVHSSPRGIDDEQIQAIARTGGVVGIIFVTPFIGPGGVEKVVDHLDHIRRLVGIEHCALGTDWEGFAVYPSDLNSAEKLPLLTEALLRRNWSASDVHALYGGNFLRVLAAVQGV